MASLARIEQIPQNETVQPQDGARRFDVSDRPFQFAVIPQVCTLAETAALLRIGSAAREFADVMAEAGKALADGRVDRHEAQAFRAQANELITVVCQFADLLDVKAGIQPPPALKAVERSA